MTARRILLCTFGSHGDLFPFIAVARALRSRGHGVVLLAPWTLESDVRRAGVEFRPAYRDVDLPGLLGDPALMHSRRGSDLVMRAITGATPAHHRQVRDLLDEEGFDLVATHPFAFGSGWAAVERGRPWISMTLAPFGWYARTDPVPLLQRRAGAWRRAAARVGDRMGRRAVQCVGGRMFNRLRRRCGLAPARGAFRETLSGGAANLGLWSPALRPSSAMDPPRGRLCGFPTYDGVEVDEATAARWRAFVDRGPPPVVVALGTSAVHAPRGFFHLALEACRSIDRRAVILAGRHRTALLDAGLRTGEDALLLEYAPFSSLLPHAAAVAHHAGIGSVAQSLRAGTPMVCVPHAFDQFHNALSVERIGAGRSVHRRGLSTARLRAALLAVLDDECGARARAIASQLGDEDGGREAASAIESVLESSAR